MPPSLRTTLAVAGGVVALAIELIGLFPADTLPTLALATAVPELALWFVATSTIGLGGALAFLRGRGALVAAALWAGALGLALVPPLLLPGTVARANGAMTAALGADWDVAAPPAQLRRMLGSPYPMPANRATEPVVVLRTTVRVTHAPDRPLIVVRPRDYSATGRPTVVLVYGGAWQFGAPESMLPLARELAGVGYTALALDYRHAPSSHFPAQRIDVEAALTAIAAHAREWDCDPARIGILGQSAGAELALLAAYRPGRQPIGAVVAEYAPTDLLAGYARPPRPDPVDVRAILRAYIGGSPHEQAALYAAGSPLLFMAPHLPPTLLIGGTRDELVRIDFQRTMRDALRVHGNRVAALELPWSQHAFDDVPGLGNRFARYYIERFFAATL